MHQSIVKLMTGTGLLALVLTSAQASGAVTLTFTSTRATFLPVGDPSINTRPLQLTSSGNAINNTRNFIYQDLVGDNAISGPWIPVNQMGPTGALIAGEQRFDYKFDQATSIDAGPPQDNKWNNNLNLTFGSFYLDGNCYFCGASNAVNIISAAPTGQAEYFGEAPGQTFGSQNKLSSNIYNIVFGISGASGTLEYTAYTDITDGVPPALRSERSGGQVIVNVGPPNPPSTGVPSPLPVIGAWGALSYSRRLRRRIHGKSHSKMA